MEVQTDHQIVGFGQDRMLLFDNETSNVIVYAERSSDGWTLKADGHADVIAPPSAEGDSPRRAVIAAMIDLALEVSPATGYSTLVPHGIEEMP